MIITYLGSPRWTPVVYMAGAARMLAKSGDVGNATFGRIALLHVAVDDPHLIVPSRPRASTGTGDGTMLTGNSRISW